MRSQKFKLEPEQCSPKISIKRYNTSSTKVEFCCKMIQIPANINDGTTGHKLQGMSKDVIVVSSWPTGGLATMFKTGNMLSCPVCANYQDYILLSQLTWTNCSNHLQNSINTLKMQDEKKQIY